MNRFAGIAAMLIALGLGTGPSVAQDAAAGGTTAEPPTIQMPAPQTVGTETGFPLPRFVSLKAKEANVRRGPSTSHRIDWVFTRRDMPLQVTAEYGHWRRVVDADGMGGWVHYIFLSGVRTVIIDTVDTQPMYSQPDLNAPEVALLEPNVVARIEECRVDWCEVSAGGYKGWVPKTALWGVGADEVLE